MKNFITLLSLLSCLTLGSISAEGWLSWFKNSPSRIYSYFIDKKRRAACADTLSEIVRNFHNKNLEENNQEIHALKCKVHLLTTQQNNAQKQLQVSRDYNASINSQLENNQKIDAGIRQLQNEISESFKREADTKNYALRIETENKDLIEKLKALEQKNNKISNSVSTDASIPFVHQSPEVIESLIKPQTTPVLIKNLTGFTMDCAHYSPKNLLKPEYTNHSDKPDSFSIEHESSLLLPALCLDTDLNEKLERDVKSYSQGLQKDITYKFELIGKRNYIPSLMYFNFIPSTYKIPVTAQDIINDIKQSYAHDLELAGFTITINYHNGSYKYTITNGISHDDFMHAQKTYPTTSA